MNPIPSQYKPILRALFEDDLAQITDHLIDNASSKVAEQLMQAIDSQIALISSHPEIYPIFEFEPSFRKMPIHNWRYVAFYTINEQKRQIVMTHIYHTSRDIYSIMRETSLLL